MPAVLSDNKVCHPHVPLAWKPVLEDLVEFHHVERQLCKDSSENLRRRAAKLHERLVEKSAALLEPQALDDLTEEQVFIIFARSVLLLMRIASSVAGDDEVLDTAGSRTLSLYEADCLADPQNQAHLKDALAKMCRLEEQTLCELEAQVAEDAQHALRKHAVVRAIRDHFGLWPDDAGLRSGIFDFFNAMYPDVGIVAEEIELIVSGTMIFFCLPFQRDELTTQRFSRLEPEAQQPIRDFLKRVNRFSQWQFAHFPVFGFRRGSELDAELLRELSERSGLGVQDVANEISTLTAIIPLEQIDKYVVHDVWGHSWQAGMLNFDQMYRQIATYADPLDLTEAAVSPDSARLSFAECFTGEGKGLRLDADVFRRFVDWEVAERLPVAVTPVLAEILADVAEFKLLATERTDELPSSSILANFPAKLDLTVTDVVFYFRQATKTFRLWAKRKARQQRTVEQLVHRGADPEAAQRAVAEAASLWQQLESDWFSADLNFRVEEDRLCVNVISRVALNFLAIHRETLRTYRRLGQLDPGRLPIKGFRDLLLICVAVFFESSPSRNLWRVDEFLSLMMEPLCERLAENA